MKAYLDGAQKILTEGNWKANRTGIRTKYVTGIMLEHDMQTGFPLLTTKAMSLRNVAIELEFFIKGLRDKRWLQERGCHIWDAWANPHIVSYGIDEDTKEKMYAESDLGRIYGVQWRQWAKDSHDGGYIDQFQNVIDTLRTNPLDRRMLVSAWNVNELDNMALPPCHFAWQLVSDGKFVDLVWYQRSCDYALGIPYNLASYALLLMLLANEVGLEPRKVVGMLADVHLYENQIELMENQIKRTPYQLPNVLLTHVGSIYDWTYEDIAVLGYQSHSKINYPLAI